MKVIDWHKFRINKYGAVTSYALVTICLLVINTRSFCNEYSKKM